MAANIATVGESLEAQVLETVLALQLEELAQPVANRPNNVTVAVDTEAKQVSLTVTMPVEIVVGASGQLEITAAPYITAAG